MKHRNQNSPRELRPIQFLAAAAVLAAAGFAAAAQEPEEEDPGRLEQLEQELNQRDPKQQEMMDLFAEVERSLQAIDDLLFEAAAGEQDLELLESGLSELFLASRERSREVADGIDSILELAQQMQQEQQQQNSSSSSQSSQSSGQQEGSPIDNRPQENQRQKESSRTEPGSPQSGQNSEDSSGKEQVESQAGERPEPKSGEQTEGEGANQDGKQAGSDPLGAGSEAGAAGQWGELPPRVQEIFSNQVSDDLPLEYREFIEAYWLRLQREG